MADDSIQAITTATPNHWHALITVWACRAGKDVHVEKPMSHSAFERFFRAVRSRKPSDVPMTVEDAHVACLHCQLANVAYRVGHTLTFDSQSEKFVDCGAADKMLTREYREGFEIPEII